MAWLRQGDTTATDERVLGVAELEDADERSLNEVWGFVNRLYAQSAQQAGDYTATIGTAMLLAPARHEVLLDQAARVGLLEVVVADGRRVIKLLDDPEFQHMRSRESIEFERARKANNSDPNLTVPVRARDGDACRYCGNVVSWSDRKSDRGGTYDHLIPGRPARTPAEMVVACQSCNGGRGDGEGDRGARFPLLAAPEVPYYSKGTMTWFEKHATTFTQLGLQMPKRRQGARYLRVGTPTRTDVPAASAARNDDVETAAPAQAGEQRSTVPDHGASAPAAPHSSGEQRAESPRGASSSSDQPERARSERGAERPASATSASSEGTRAGTAEVPRSARGVPDDLAATCTFVSGVTSGNAGSGFPADRRHAGSGFAGSGRDGTGRAGPGPDGRPRPQGAPAASPGGRRRKRGRRRKS